MFHRHEKRKGTLPPNNTKDLIRTIDPQALLGEDKRLRLMHKIEEASILEKERFQNLCLSLMHELAKYCQLLPETANRHYAQLGGFIDYALHRTEAALNLFKRYLLLDSSGLATEEQKLWQYALFSAALLQGIGKFYTDLQVNMFDKNGHFLKTRNPLSELLSSSYYVYTFNTQPNEEFRQRLNSLIARFIMPASGFDWISLHPKVFETWLALLNEDFYKAGTLGFILDRAKAIALQDDYLNMPRTAADRLGPYGHLPFGAHTVETNPQMDYQLGVDFIQWLKKALEKGDIVLDQHPLFIAAEGLIINTELFKRFIRNNPQYKSWPSVQNGFLSLGLHRLGLGGEAIANYEHLGTHQIQKGILCTNYNLALPETLSQYDHKTGETKEIAALELMAQMKAKDLAILTPAGTWEAKNQVSQKGLSHSV